MMPVNREVRHGLEGGLHRRQVGVGPQKMAKPPKNIQILEDSRLAGQISKQDAESEPSSQPRPR